MDLTITTIERHVENRSWLLSQLGQGPGENPTVALKMSLFTAAGLAPKGYVPSGTAVGIITAESPNDQVPMVGPYDGSATDGRETCFGLLHSLVPVPAGGGNATGSTVHIGFVRRAKLPSPIDAAGQADLKMIHFS